MADERPNLGIKAQSRDETRSGDRIALSTRDFLVCLDRAGTELWRFDFGPRKDGPGSARSNCPLLARRHGRVALPARHVLRARPDRPLVRARRRDRRDPRRRRPAHRRRPGRLPLPAPGRRARAPRSRLRPGRRLPLQRTDGPGRHGLGPVAGRRLLGAERPAHRRPLAGRLPGHGVRVQRRGGDLLRLPLRGGAMADTHGGLRVRPRGGSARDDLPLVGPVHGRQDRGRGVQGRDRRDRGGHGGHPRTGRPTGSRNGWTTAPTRPSTWSGGG